MKTVLVIGASVLASVGTLWVLKKTGAAEKIGL